MSALLDLAGSVARAVRRLLGRGQDDPNARAGTGRRGERAAAAHLKRLGYRILERNYRVRQGEIDLVAFRDGTVAFVEVRALTQPAHVHPLQTVTPAKQRRVVRAAHSYVARKRLGERGVRLRFDVVAVLLDADGRIAELEHVEGAFQETPGGFS